MVHRFEITDDPDPSTQAKLADPLLAYNVALLGGHNRRPLAILIRSGDASEVIGGLWGRTSFQWLFVKLLFVPEALRSQGLGTRLLESAEAGARQRGCRGAWLDTFSAAAARFYSKQGYELFGSIPDYPAGNTRHFFSKNFKRCGLVLALESCAG